jgi:hypothetical protein
MVAILAGGAHPIFLGLFFYPTATAVRDQRNGDGLHIPANPFDESAGH